MAGRFVRASKYRHVFGRSSRKEQCYDNLRISKNAWDTNLVKANPSYLSVNWEASGGGAFAVIPLHEKGKLPDLIPLFRGHTAAVLDTDWSPFDDSLIASASDDGKVFLWRVPEGFTLRTDEEEPTDISPFSKLTGHSRKVGHVLFNPAAENVLATASGDYTIKIWDAQAGSAKLTLKQGDIVQSLSWSANGSLLVTTSRDKKLRVWDVRQQRPAQEVPGHPGAKNSRAVWMGEHDRVATTGFSKMSDRQLGLWDIRDAREPIGGFQILDSISGVCMPFWDDGTQCLYLAGKGDGNIRYFEYENDKFEFLSEYKSADPQRGIAFLPKRAVNTHENEVMRAFKTVNDSYIEPISFIVPRRAEVFQEDIYPPAVGTEPAVSANEWFDGKDGLPRKIDLGSLYNGEEPVTVAPDYKPAITRNGPTSGAKEEKPTIPREERKEPTPMKVEDTKESIFEAARKMANRVDDDEEEADDDSTFDDVPYGAGSGGQPAQRIISVPTKAEPVKGTTQPESVPAKDLINNDEHVVSKAGATQSGNPPTSSRNQDSAITTSNEDKTSPAEPLRIQSSLDDIKSLLEQQNRTLAAQSDQIGHLRDEVDTLKVKMAEGEKKDRHSTNNGGVTDTDREKDERIKELEEELGRLQQREASV